MNIHQTFWELCDRTIGLSALLTFLMGQSLVLAQTTIFTTKHPQYSVCYQQAADNDIYYDAENDRAVFSQAIATDMRVASRENISRIAKAEQAIRDNARWSYRINKHFGITNKIQAQSATSESSSQPQTSRQCPVAMTDFSDRIDVKGFKKCLTQQHVIGERHPDLDIPGETFNCIQFLTP